MTEKDITKIAELAAKIIIDHLEANKTNGIKISKYQWRILNKTLW
jgi:hypothetical protein